MSLSLIWPHSEGGGAQQAPKDIPVKITWTALGDTIFFFLKRRQGSLA